MALQFSNGYIVKFELSLGGHWIVCQSSHVSALPIVQGINTLFHFNDGTTLALAETCQSMNFVKMSNSWTFDSTWDTRRSPDILDEELAFSANLDQFTRQCPEYFAVSSIILPRRAMNINICVLQSTTLFEMLFNQSLFNGIGSYLANEICHQLSVNLGN